jgi:hypothetical protein
LNKEPREAAAIPLPREDTTPPVIKTYLVMFNYIDYRRNSMKNIDIFTFAA